MKTIELDFHQLPLLIKIRGKAKEKSYLLKSSSRKLAACLVGIEEPFRHLLTEGN